MGDKKEKQNSQPISFKIKLKYMAVKNWFLNMNERFL